VDAIRYMRDPEKQLDGPRPEDIEAWDRITELRRFVAIGGLDAHQVGKRIAGHVPLRLMSYRRSFRLLTMHVLVPELLSGDLERDRAIVFDALRAGRSYIARDWIAPARGFSFTRMGEETTERPELQVRLPRPASVRLLRDGGVVASADDAAELDHSPAEPGVYRVEARIGGRIWILSNAVYLR
jgi:hypothetical protein